MSERSKLGETLVAMGYLSPDELRRGLDCQRGWRLQSYDEDSHRLGQVLLELGLCGAEHVAKGLAYQAGLRYCKPSKYQLADNAIAALSRDVALEYRVLPLKLGERTVVLGFEDAPNFFVLDNLRVVLAREIEAVICSEEELTNALREYYGEPPAPDWGLTRVRTGTHIIRAALLHAQGEIKVDLRGEFLRVQCASEDVEFDHELPLGPSLQGALLAHLELEDAWQSAGCRVPTSRRVEISVGTRRVHVHCQLLQDHGALSLTLIRMP